MRQPDPISTKGASGVSSGSPSLQATVPGPPPLVPASSSSSKCQHGVATDRTSRTHSRAPRRKLDVARPNDPSCARQQISWEYQNVENQTYEHNWRANRWDTLASWQRVIVTLTASVSALSVFADSQIMATVFAAITALVTAVNVGFNPLEKAKSHRDAARAYGHLERPLAELLYVL
jgi:hypothetical protein